MVNDVYELTDILCVNETEVTTPTSTPLVPGATTARLQAGQLTGFKVHSKETFQQAAEALLLKGCNTVIITLGEQGACYCTRQLRTLTYVSIDKVRVEDTTVARQSRKRATSLASLSSRRGRRPATQSSPTSRQDSFDSHPRFFQAPTFELIEGATLPKFQPQPALVCRANQLNSRGNNRTGIDWGDAPSVAGETSRSGGHVTLRGLEA
ncbi:hypothetical protein HPB47_028005 [Ixodes persulcatus]|uniref:Uncharacterized protein n=1 Tax=Ixodes persulcatus TaxID=34615 RepID=A0AC60PUZ3_IXOPE|nr:hypothetical protein HPB47_028005 [Ixodes persulcatus]